jgi:hypothetical protein
VIKLLICLIWGHQPFVKIDTVVHEPKHLQGKIEVTGYANDWITLMRGSTVTLLQCPRCCKIKVVTL